MNAAELAITLCLIYVFFFIGPIIADWLRFDPVDDALNERVEGYLQEFYHRNGL